MFNLGTARHNNVVTYVHTTFNYTDDGLDGLLENFRVKSLLLENAQMRTKICDVNTIFIDYNLIISFFKFIFDD